MLCLRVGESMYPQEKVLKRRNLDTGEQARCGEVRFAASQANVEVALQDLGSGERREVHQDRLVFLHVSFEISADLPERRIVGIKVLC